jgi:AcrR family transcriptional regulator
VLDITARAGVTRRTFFRHFPDKREVLFSGGVTDLPETTLVAGVAEADDGLMPVQMIVSAIAGYDWDALAPRPQQRQRHAVILANSELLERELIKHEAAAVALTEVLRQRGFDSCEARLAADIGIAVFRAAYDRWLNAGDGTGMSQIIEDVLAVLRTTVAATAGSPLVGP